MTLRLDAYEKIAASLPEKRATVFQAILACGARGATLRELVAALGWTINRISGRVSELANSGYLREVGARDGMTVWVACEDGAARPKRKARIVKATIVGIEHADFFSKCTIRIALPPNAPSHEFELNQIIAVKL